MMKTLRTTIWLATGLLGLFALVAVPAAADQVILDDLIVDGSACIGLDCVNGESFGFDTLRLKENNLRIRAVDTSSSASFPSNDWQITFNDSSNGGQNKYSIDDLDGGRTPFTIEAGAPSHSLYVDDGGRIGLGTANPVVEVHVVDGDTPTVRLEQDGSSGFTAQTWDVAGNETNYFIRDATNGSKLPFRIRPNADSNSIYVDTDSDVGIGTSSPDARLHIVETTAGAQDMLEMTNNGNTTVRVIDSASGESWAQVYSQTAGAQGGRITFNENTENVAVELTLDAQGNLTVRGELFSTTCVVPCAPDYVFEPGYSLMPLEDLSAFVAEKKHLPNVPSADELVGPINVSEMQMRLLEKIEELTLYAIDQHETIEALTARLEALEGQQSE